MLINKQNPVTSDFIPNDLVKPFVLFADDGELEKNYISKKAGSNYEKMFLYALKEEIIFTFVSGYRSYRRQNEIYNESILKKGLAHTEKYIASPGCSEHQSGLAIDVSTPRLNDELEDIFGETKEGKWLCKNAHKYGFIIRYPKGKEEITGYNYEPWHIRYVGVDIATLIYKNNWTLEEYIFTYGKNIV